MASGTQRRFTFAGRIRAKATSNNPANRLTSPHCLRITAVLGRWMTSRHYEWKEFIGKYNVNQEYGSGMRNAT
jgi:hypothetical protein